MRLPIVGVIFLFVLGILADTAIFFDIRKNVFNSRLRKIWLWIWGILSAIGLAAIITAVSMPLKDGDRSIIPVMWIIFSWVSFYVPKLIYLIFAGIAALIGRICHRRFNGLRIAGVVVALIAFFVIWEGALVGRKDIEVTHVTAEFTDLPEAFDGMRIVQFSDIHVGSWGDNTRFVDAFVDSINAQNADIVLFTGDIVNRSTEELLPFTSSLSRLRGKMGVWSVLGNHDYGDYMNWPSEQAKRHNLQMLDSLERGMGWHLLRNEHGWLHAGNDSIAIIGVENWGEPPFKQYGKLAQAWPEKQYNDSTFKILLTHNPEHWRLDVSEKTNIQLSLSGHTHAMQAAFHIGKWHFSPASLRYPLWGGMYGNSNKLLYVNVGSGEVALPFRIADARPEITVITIKRKR